MNTPFLEDHHRRLGEQVDRFVSEQVRDAALGETEDEQVRNLVRALAREGLLEYTVPAQFESGARSLDVRALCVMREHLCYESSLADLMFAMQGLGSFPVALAGSDEIKQQLLPKVKSGDAIAAFAITEPEAGSDVSALQTTARRDGASYVLDGVKTFISNAGVADFYTVFAKTDATKGSKGISAFVVEKQTPGFYFEEKIELIAPHPIGRIRFDGCRVPLSNLLGEQGAGFKIAMTTLDTFRPTVGAAAVGLAWRALDEAISYSKRRVQFGRPISEFQATQIKLSKLFRNVTGFNSLEMSHSFFSFLGNKTSSRSCGNCGKLVARFLRRVFQALVGKWENMQFVFPLFHMRGSFHSFPL